MGIRDNIYLRLFLPFSVTLLLATLLAWWIATGVLERILEQRLENQLQHAAAVLAEGDFPLTPALLQRLSRPLHVDILLLGRNGRLGLSSLANYDESLNQQVISVFSQQKNQVTGR